MEAGNYFPGKVIETKPDAHYLYQLAKAHNPGDRKYAVMQLYNTTNPNLFSTVLGIAMDDSDPEMRLTALERADDLSASGRMKLKDTIIRLSTADPEERVRIAAKKLVDKYYN